MYTMIISVLLSLLLSSSCNSTKQTTANSPAPVPPPPPESPAPPPAMNTKTECRLIISFISIGEGTDPKAREIMDGSIKNWEERFKTKFEMESIPWGREGEVDFCFKLEELNEGDRAVFVDEIKSMFDGNKLVQISENQPSIHKR